MKYLYFKLRCQRPAEKKTSYNLLILGNWAYDPVYHLYKILTLIKFSAFHIQNKTNNKRTERFKKSLSLSFHKIYIKLLQVTIQSFNVFQQIFVIFEFIFF